MYHKVQNQDESAIFSQAVRFVEVQAQDTKPLQYGQKSEGVPDHIFVQNLLQIQVQTESSVKHALFVENAVLKHKALVIKRGAIRQKCEGVNHTVEGNQAQTRVEHNLNYAVLS